MSVLLRINPFGALIDARLPDPIRKAWTTHQQQDHSCIRHVRPTANILECGTDGTPLIAPHPKDQCPYTQRPEDSPKAKGTEGQSSNDGDDCALLIHSGHLSRCFAFGVPIKVQISCVQMPLLPPTGNQSFGDTGQPSGSTLNTAETYVHVLSSPRQRAVSCQIVRQSGQEHCSPTSDNPIEACDDPSSRGTLVLSRPAPPLSLSLKPLFCRPSSEPYFVLRRLSRID